ncbi:DinB family protein [Fulvivirga sp. M361]|uniref:DinB family protein n=1 Tax=Fulvivirga sp. M361 TaxID=2594266 RepID=UPI00117A9356|nr:DinB family protein [Fulvivirga sp. M361]TRX59106.1 DinB family protein [Fulvivirga sp. M361]
MSNKIKQYIEECNTIFNGDPWHGGGSLLQKLNSMDHRYINDKCICSANSIVRLVAHLIRWKVFTLKKLQGDMNFKIELNSTEDWPDIHISSETEWFNLIEDLTNTQEQLIGELENMAFEKLDDIVPGENYSHGYLISGIIQHDVYHLGQIQLIYNTVSKA